MKNASGFIWSRTNRMERSISALPMILRGAVTNIVKDCIKGSPKNMGLRLWSGVPNFQPRLRPLLMKRKSKNGNAIGKNGLSMSSIRHGEIYMNPSIKGRHSGKFSFLPRQRKKENLSGIPFGYFKLININGIPHLNAMLKHRASCGMTPLFSRAERERWKSRIVTSIRI